MTYDFLLGAVWALVLVLVGFLIGLLVMAYANWWGPNGAARARRRWVHPARPRFADSRSGTHVVARTEGKAVTDRDPLMEPFPFEVSIAIWGYDLRGSDILNIVAALAENHGDFIDANRLPLWDHPEWLEGWYRDGHPYRPPHDRALPYVGESAHLWTEVTA